MSTDLAIFLVVTTLAVVVIGAGAALVTAIRHVATVWARHAREIDAILGRTDDWRPGPVLLKDDR